MLPTLPDDAIRLLAAAILGMALGATRDLSGKPAGLRTMGLVCLGSAIATLTALRAFDALGPDPQSRVIQGVVQGVLTGVGFIGAGAVLHGQHRRRVRGLTTAALVWVAAALGVACGLGMWSVVITGAAATLLLVVVLRPLEKRIERRRPGNAAGQDGEQSED